MAFDFGNPVVSFSEEMSKTNKAQEEFQRSCIPSRCGSQHEVLCLGLVSKMGVQGISQRREVLFGRVLMGQEHLYTACSKTVVGILLRTHPKPPKLYTAQEIACSELEA